MENRNNREKIFLFIYFIVLITVYITSAIVFNDAKRYISIVFFGILFYIARLIVINPFSKKERSKHSTIARYIIWIALLSIPIFYLYVYSINNNYFPLVDVEFDKKLVSENIVSIEEQEDGKFVITCKDKLKILQLTDLHIGASYESYDYDKKAGETIRDLIYKSEPDLIIVTGDLIYPISAQSFSFNNRTMFLNVFEFFNKFGIPWTFTLGNHDFEVPTNINKHFTNGIIEPKELIEFASTYDNLLISKNYPDIYGRYNNIIEVRNMDGSLNQLLYLIDSNSYISDKLNDYDYIHMDQVEWYYNSVKEYNLKEGKNVSSMMFFHIPLQEFNYAYNDYVNGALQDVEYLFGEHREKTCSSNHSTDIFDKILELGSTKAIFCGHDHLNDIGIKYKGVDLVYGKSIDYYVYPRISTKDEQRGGLLVTLNYDSSYEYKQIDYKKIK